MGVAETAGRTGLSYQMQKLRYGGTVLVLFLLPFAFGWYVVQPLPALAHSRVVVAHKPFIINNDPIAFVSGQPNRIVIPDSNVDLPVDAGYYDATTGEWTLAGLRAQFATISAPANNQSGETFIYGHNNNSVFGALRHNTPVVGAQALVYADNGRVFSYRYSTAETVGPNDVSILDYIGAPELVIQTCTGSLNELRTMYHFSFDKLVQ